MKDQTWLVPKRFLKVLGSNAAYVLAKLCYLQYGANKRNDPRFTRDKKQWFFSTMEEMQQLYFPWLSTTALYSIIKQLENEEFIEVGRGFNRMKCKSDHTLWYYVPVKYVKQWRYKKDEQFFCAEHLSKFKRNHVAKAVLLSLICREYHLLSKTREAKISINLPRNKFARETGIAPSSVSDMIEEFITMKLIAGSGESYGPLIEIPPAITKLKARGEGRKRLCTITGVEAQCLSNPHAVVIVSKPSDRLRNLTALVNASMRRGAKVKAEKKARKRKRGKTVKPIGEKSARKDWKWTKKMYATYGEKYLTEKFGEGFKCYKEDEKPAVRRRNKVALLS